MMGISQLSSEENFGCLVYYRVDILPSYVGSIMESKNFFFSWLSFVGGELPYGDRFGFVPNFLGFSWTPFQMAFEFMAYK